MKLSKINRTLIFHSIFSLLIVGILFACSSTQSTSAYASTVNPAISFVPCYDGYLDGHNVETTTCTRLSYPTNIDYNACYLLDVPDFYTNVWIQSEYSSDDDAGTSFCDFNLRRLNDTYANGTPLYFDLGDVILSDSIPWASLTIPPSQSINYPAGHDSIMLNNLDIEGYLSSGGSVNVSFSTDNQGEPIPPAFKILNAFYNITTTATFTEGQLITLKFKFNTDDPDQDLAVLHYNESTLQWDTLTPVKTVIDPYPGYVYLTVTTNSLSPFAIVAKDTTPPALSNFQLSPYVISSGTSSTISVNADDSGTGIEAVIFKLKSGTGQEITGSLNLNSTTGKWEASVSPSTGVYQISVTAIDKAGSITTYDEPYLAVYDPSAGFVTSGGWLIPDNSPVGISSGGKANFGSEIKYINGSPSGEFTLNYNLDNLKFKSTSIDWLTVNGSAADFQGQAGLNGSGNYTFRVHMVDGSPDNLDIRIWGNDKSFDNPTYRLSNNISGGNIKIHN